MTVRAIGHRHHVLRAPAGIRPRSRQLGDSVPASGRGTVVVIGGGFAGMLAALAVHETAERVVVIERDRYPAGPHFRQGTPQARHAHLLLEGGHRTLESMLPGIRAELLAAGASRVAMSRDLRWRSSAGWMADYDSPLAFWSCSRSLLDHTVRARVRTACPTMQVRENTEVVGLVGSPRMLTGVRVRIRGSDEERELPAQMIIDASGRGSRLPQWLTALGCAPVPDDVVDVGMRYTSRFYHRPPTAADLGFEALYLQTRPAQEFPWTGALLPVEDNRWIVSLGAVRGGEPAPGPAGFDAILSQLDPVLHKALRDANPDGPVRGFSAGPSVRRHYEHASTPAGLVVLGDGQQNMDPVYGQGMTVAALSAQALSISVHETGNLEHRTASTARARIANVTKPAWLMSCAEDLRWPCTLGGTAGPLTRIQHRFLDRVLASATTNPRVTAAFHEVMSLVSPATTLLRPTVLAPILLHRS